MADVLTLEKIEEIGSAIDKAVETCQLAEASTSTFSKSILMARGIKEIKARMTPEVMADILPLMNTGLGFRTDKDPKVGKKNRDTGKYEYPVPYHVDVVKDCLTEGLIKGAFPVGNEINIIAGRCYFTREYFKRKVGDIKDVTDLVPTPGLPRISNGGAVVPFTVTYKYQGAEKIMKRDIAVKANEGMGADAIIGKAERKMLKWVYETVTGSKMSVPDAEIDADGGFIDASPVASTSSAPNAGAAGQNAVAAAIIEKAKADEEARAKAAQEQQQQQQQAPAEDAQQDDGTYAEMTEGDSQDPTDAPGGDAPPQTATATATSTTVKADAPPSDLNTIPDKISPEWFKDKAMSMRPPTIAYGDAGRRIDTFLRVGLPKPFDKMPRQNLIALVNTLQDPATSPVWK